ncbi:MAG TPA: polysaccharide deacetylase family protein [Ferruginibacter sp.]|nr:polysaccharide deacetylase family protein [Ferruginibacter sp.]
MAKGLVLNFHQEDGLLFEQIVHIIRKQYKIISLAGLVEVFNTTKKIDNLCHFTFDDGHKSFYDNIFPVLKKHNVPVSLFVSPAVIQSGNNYWFQEIEGYRQEIMELVICKKLNIPAQKIKGLSYVEILLCLPVQDISDIIRMYQEETQCRKKNPLNMNAEELLETHHSGLVAIGAHTLNHPILANENDESSYREINGSISQLEDMINHPVHSFAYPNGRPGLDFGEREMNYLKDTGVLVGFSTAIGHLSPFNNMLSIPRMGFARMGLSPGNPLVSLRLLMGKRWFDIRSFITPSEKNKRNRIKKLLA